MSVERVAAKPANAGMLREVAAHIVAVVAPFGAQADPIIAEQSARLRALADVLDKITPQGVEVLRMAVGNLPHGFSPDDGADDAAAESVLTALDEITQ